ncbi:MAG: hypothetical protein CL840_02325 [Crocinitomicaceae bacterium]|nr:hypothetical protein [Crocinitomicaceae bacterium]
MGSFAQDVIYKKNGEQIHCKVEEVSEDRVKYRREDNEEGPLYSMFKREVLVITYENGTYEYPNVITQSEIKPNPVSEPGTEKEREEFRDFNRNFIGINLLNLYHGNLNLSYQHIFSSGKVAIRFPIKIGFDNLNHQDYYFPSLVDQKVIGSIEADLLFFPAGQRWVSYVNGIGVEAGALNSFTESNSSVSSLGNSVQYYTHVTKTYTTLYFYNGFTIKAGKNFGMSVLLGIGPKKFLDSRNRLEFMTNFSFNMGYSF